MQHYKTIQVAAPEETGSAAADIVQAVMQAKLLQGLQTPRSGLYSAVPSRCYPYLRPRRPEMEMICIRYPTLLKQKYNRQASHDTCLCVYPIACSRSKRSCGTMSGMPSGTITSRYQLHETAPVTEYVPHAVGGRFLPSHVGKPLLVTPIHNEGNGFCAVISLEGFLYERAVSGSIRRR